MQAIGRDRPTIGRDRPTVQWALRDTPLQWAHRTEIGNKYRHHRGGDVGCRYYCSPRLLCGGKHRLRMDGVLDNLQAPQSIIGRQIAHLWTPIMRGSEAPGLPAQLVHWSDDHDEPGTLQHLLSPVYTIQPVVKTVYNWFDNRLYRVNEVL